MTASVWSISFVSQSVKVYKPGVTETSLIVCFLSGKDLSLDTWLQLASFVCRASEQSASW